MKKKIAIITSRFNTAVTDRLTIGAKNHIETQGYNKYFDFFYFDVAGAYELPLLAKWCLDSNFNAVIALGAVIRGETTHYDYVCNSVERGLTQLQLNYSCPVVFGVLTTENKEQAFSRSGGAKCDKGAESVEVAIEMLKWKDKILK